HLLVHQRLALADRLGRGAQHRMAERDRTVDPRVETVGPTIRDGVEHRSDKAAVRGPAVKMVDCGDSAHPITYREDALGLTLRARGAAPKMGRDERSVAIELELTDKHRALVLEPRVCDQFARPVLRGADS